MKYLFDLAKEFVETEKVVLPVKLENHAIAALTDQFQSVMDAKTHINAERVVTIIDEIVKS